MFRSFVFVLLIIGVIASIVWGINRHEKVLEMQSELTLTQAELNSVQEGLSSCQQTLDSTLQELKTRAETIRSLESEIGSLESEISSLEWKVGSLESEIGLYKDTWGSVYSGSNRPWADISLVNNANALDPTWAELLDFLRWDETSQNTYVPDGYVCRHFAMDVHNNAEEAGIRAAYVGMSMRGSAYGHAFNAFKTTDRGLVFIDCTGSVNPQPGWCYCRLVEVQLGGNYASRYLLSEDDWTTRWGTVTKLAIYW